MHETTPATVPISAIMPPDNDPTLVPLFVLLLLLLLWGLMDDEEDVCDAVDDAGAFCAGGERTLEVGVGLWLVLTGELAGVEGNFGTEEVGELTGELDAGVPSPARR